MQIYKKRSYISEHIRSYLYVLTDLYLDLMERSKEIPEIVLQVGEKIDSIIKQKGLKPRHVAHDSDLDVEALRRYIKGKQIMGIDKLYRIAQALDVQIEELFKLTDE